MNQITKQHHIIPKVILKKFSSDDKKLLYYLDRKNDEEKKPDISKNKLSYKNKKFTENHFYSFQDSFGNYDTSVEDDLGEKYENELDKILEKIKNKK